MSRFIDDIIKRSVGRPKWQVEVSSQDDKRCVVRSPAHDVVADGLSRSEAEMLTRSYNAARDDAAALAYHLSEWKLVG